MVDLNRAVRDRQASTVVQCDTKYSAVTPKNRAAAVSLLDDRTSNEIPHFADRPELVNLPLRTEKLIGRAVPRWKTYNGNRLTSCRC